MTIGILDNEIMRDAEYIQRMQAQNPFDSHVLLVKHFIF